MDHPDGVMVYRVTAGGRTVVFATDVEHGDGLDRDFLKFCEGTDLLIHDAQYTDAEYRGVTCPAKAGWGHSTWNQAVSVGRLCGAERLALFHHDPTRTDTQVAVIEDRARELHDGAFAAREGTVIDL